MDAGDSEMWITRVVKEGLHPLQAPLNPEGHIRKELFEQRVPGHLG